MISHGSFAAILPDERPAKTVTHPADVATDLPQLHEGFRVTDASSASWVVRRINEARAHAKWAEQWADLEVRRARRDEEFLMFRFGQQLQDYATRELARLRGRRRSIGLPGGTIGFRKLNPVLVIDDPAAVLAWAHAQCADAVVTKEQLVKSVINKHVESTGEIPDGTHMEVGRDKFYVS